MDRSLHSHSFSHYQPNDSLFDSHLTRVTQPQDHEDNWFQEQRAYSRSVLSSWGLALGEMPYNPDNERTLRAVVQLIAFRQKDLQFRSKAKQEIAAVNFEKEKYRSFMEQAQRSLEEVSKRLGRTENEASQLKNKGKRSEALVKKEREDDRKMIAMLRTKNQQIMHEIKKKEAEVSRVKEQMKKSVGQKSLLHVKNSFEVLECLSPSKREPSNKEQAKYAFLMQRNEREMSQLAKQNGILRQKLFQLRDKLLDFNQWIDKQLFGEVEGDPFQRDSRFPLNHNMLFHKESLVREFADLLQTAKDGIVQLRSFYRTGSTPLNKKNNSAQNVSSQSSIEELNFKKKAISKTDSNKTDRSRHQTKEIKAKQTPNNKRKEVNPMDYNLSPRLKNHLAVPKFQSLQQTPILQKDINKGFSSRISEIKSHKGSISMNDSDLGFGNELMSDVTSNADSSILSQIQVDKFDKWDSLFQNDA